jgi:NAD(P)-dependent dehydrogenase (short-subunit alcohol dehydrogenase family)
MNDPLFTLNNQVAVVTGGLGQLGRQFTQALQERGARVVVLDQRVPEGMASDSNTFYLATDVTCRKQLETSLLQIEARWETPSILINNAALDSAPGASPEENGPFETYPECSWDNVMEVNVKGVFLCCQVFGGAMAATGKGSIINISSIYGMVSPDQRIYQYKTKDGSPPFFKPVAYSASKSALLNLTRYLATYWARSGVRVNSLTLAGVWNNQAPEFLEGYCPKVPLGRMANADDYNGAIVFLSSQASSYMTGSNLVVDGGFTAW